MIEESVKLFDEEQSAAMWKGDTGKRYEELMKGTSVWYKGEARLVADSRLERVVQHLEVWMMEQTDCVEIRRHRKTGEMKRKFDSGGDPDEED